MKKKILVSILTLSLGLSVCTGSLVFAAEHNKNVVYTDDSMTQEMTPDIAKDYKINSNGKTYGSGSAALYVEDMPDLMRVIGDNGKEGYVYTSEVIGDPPASPEEAIRIQEENEAKGYTPTEVLNVYDSEGNNVIDTFTIQND